MTRSAQLGMNMSVTPDSPLSHCAQQSRNCITAVSRHTMIITTIIHPVDERDGRNVVEKDRTLEIKRGRIRHRVDEEASEWCGSGKAPQLKLSGSDVHESAG
jgi:hypothetical protein